MKRIQRSRKKGWRMPEGAIYVGRPSLWGNPFPVDGDKAMWLALAVGERADPPGRRRAAVKCYREWMTDGFLPIPATTPGPGDIEYSSGATRHIKDIPVAMGLLMLVKDGPYSMPPNRPDPTPLRGHDLACWCPLVCGSPPPLYAVAYGEQYDPCTKPDGHAGGCDPSIPPWCHADVLLELANA